MGDAKPWLLDEVASAGRENLDVEHVARYDDKEDADAAAEVALLRGWGLDERSTVVDLGAGTGQFTLAVAGVAARVVAVDVSTVMLERLRAKLRAADRVADRPAAGRAEVEAVRGGFVTYEHRGSPADVVYSRYALHHVPDFWKGVALARIAAMLRPGGVFRLWDVVYGFEPSDADERIGAWIADSSSTSVADGWTTDELAEHVRDEHSTYTWLLEPMIERAGFTIEDARRSDDGMFARYVCRRSAPGNP